MKKKQLKKGEEHKSKEITHLAGSFGIKSTTEGFNIVSKSKNTVNVNSTVGHSVMVQCVVYKIFAQWKIVGDKNLYGMIADYF